MGVNQTSRIAKGFLNYYFEIFIFYFYSEPKLLWLNQSSAFYTLHFNRKIGSLVRNLYIHTHESWEYKVWLFEIQEKAQCNLTYQVPKQPALESCVIAGMDAITLTAMWLTSARCHIFREFSKKIVSSLNGIYHHIFFSCKKCSAVIRHSKTTAWEGWRFS